MLKSLLYRVFKGAVGLSFNTLNLLMAGNLPPFGCVCVVIEDEDKFLVIERPEGGYVFPGGFMRWRENPVQTAQREAMEETGLQLRVKGLIGCSSTVGEYITQMSTLTVIYHAEVIDGILKNSIEGRACWQDQTELQNNLQPRQRGILKHFLSYREQKERVEKRLM